MMDMMDMKRKLRALAWLLALALLLTPFGALGEEAADPPAPETAEVFVEPEPEAPATPETAPEPEAPAEPEPEPAAEDGSAVSEESEAPESPVAPEADAEPEVNPEPAAGPEPESEAPAAPEAPQEPEEQPEDQPKSPEEIPAGPVPEETQPEARTVADFGELKALIEGLNGACAEAAYDGEAEFVFAESVVLPEGFDFTVARADVRIAPEALVENRGTLRCGLLRVEGALASSGEVFAARVEGEERVTVTGGVFEGLSGDYTETLYEADPEEIAGEGGGDNAALFDEYVRSVLYSRVPGMDVKRFGSYNGDKLSGPNRVIYDTLKAYILEIAAGDRASTELEVPIETLGIDKIRWTQAELETEDRDEGAKLARQAYVSNYNMRLVIQTLLADLPYDFYWYDKTLGTRSSGPTIAILRYKDGHYEYEARGALRLEMRVAEAYAESTFVMDTEIGKSVQSTVAKAKAIVEKYAGLPDYAKLAAYKREICGLVSYEYSAAREGTAYGDYWQVIYVFDGDDGTNVVCEGYAKAFQYLCDLTQFEGPVQSYILTGTLNAGAQPENHMWNIVHMPDGKNYLVDVTNCDQGTVGADEKLFLKGWADGGPDHGYTFDCGGSAVQYVYSDSAFLIYSEAERTLSQTDYVPTHAEREGWNHVLEEVPEVPAACETEGNIAHWRCQICGALFAEERGIEELTGEQIVLAALGHQWDDGVVTLEPGCETLGERLYTCQRDGAHTMKEEIEPTGHAWDAGVVTLKPTCDAEGERLYTCQNDPEHTRREAIDALGHDLIPVEGATPTCEDEGVLEHWMCARCGRLFDAAEDGAELTDEEVILPALGHSLTKVEAVAPACETPGNIEYYACAACEKLFLDDEAGEEIAEEETVLAALGHAYGEWETVTPATCEEPGEEKRVCANDENHVETRAIPALGHSLTKVEAVSSTCEDEGNIEHYACKNCGKFFLDDEAQKEITEEEIVLAALGHAYGEWETVTPATCEEPGEEKRVCANDENHVETRAIPALGHSLTKVEAVAPTCETPGNIEYYACATCGKLFLDDEAEEEISEEEAVLAAIGHAYGEWETVTPATCEEPGEEKRVCANDENHVETREIPALGHSLTKVEAVAPTCEEAGNIEYYACATCGKLFLDDEAEEEIPEEETVLAALGHAYGEWETVTPATCEGPGEEKRVCANDENHVETRAIPALGHSLMKVEAVAPTCEEAGNIEYYTCATCGKLFADREAQRAITEAQTVLAALGHAYGEWETVVPATCEEAGEEKRVCARDESHVETREVPALGHALNRILAVAPTCEEAGNIEYYACATCGKLFRDAAAQEEIALADAALAPLGHLWDKGRVTREPTVERTGERLYTCRRDSRHTRTEEIPKLPDPNAAPRTGDEGHLLIWAALLVFSGAGAALVWRRGRRKAGK